MANTCYQDDRVTLHHGDCLDVLRSLPDTSVDSVVTDPPYGLTNRTPDVLGCVACGRTAIEMTGDYLPLIKARIARHYETTTPADRSAHADAPLFDLEGNAS